MYSKIAEEADTKVAEQWLKDTEGIILFVCSSVILMTVVRANWKDTQTGLFSAVVATMISVSIQDLKPDPQDISAFYLKQIYLIQVNPNASHPSNPTAVAKPPVFSPPSYAVSVNTLWFLSLIISLSCAMVATLVQQWARRYIKATRPVGCSPQKRARARAFFTIGVAKSRLPSVVERLPTMIHLSLFLFFLGLISYLSNLNRVVFSAVVLCTALILAGYVCVTLMSRYWLDCPYHTPFASKDMTILAVLTLPLNVTSHKISVPITTGISCIVFMLQIWLDPGKSTRNWIFLDTEEQVEEAIAKRSSELDTHVLEFALDALREDDAREKFLELVPGFYQSNAAKGLRQCLSENVQSKMHDTLIGFFSRTLSSNSVLGLARLRRLATCLAAADEMGTSAEFESDLQSTTWQNWNEMPRSVEFGELLRSLDKGGEGRYTRWILSNLIADVIGRDESWIALAMDHLGIPEHALRDYLAHGDSVKLALIIQSIRHAIRSNFSHFCLLPPLSEIDVRNTLPGLQHEFCDLWNTLAQNSRDRGDPSSSISMLKATRHIYVALHPGTDVASTSTDTVNINHVLNQPSSYPLCNTSDHRPDSTIQVHNATVVENSESHPPHATPESILPLASSESESIHAPESRLGDSIPHPGGSLPDDQPPPNPTTPVERPIAHRPSILAPVILDRLCFTCATSQPDRSSLIPEYPPPSPAATTPLVVHQETSIVDYNVSLNGAELGVHDDPQASNTPASSVTVYHPHSTTPDNDMTGESSTSPLAGDPVPGRNSGPSTTQVRSLYPLDGVFYSQLDTRIYSSPPSSHKSPFVQHVGSVLTDVRTLSSILNRFTSRVGPSAPIVARTDSPCRNDSDK